MKAAQLLAGKTYEDKKGTTQRTIRDISQGRVYFVNEMNHVVHIGAQEFAAWAARPAGARKPKKEK